MVQPDEGVLVFYHFAGQRRDDDALEYIQPESTGSEHDTNTRDRLTYLFPLLPASESKKKRRFNFVVKILTFKRKGGTSDEIMERVGSSLFDSFGKRTKFMLYRPTDNAFVEEDGPDLEKKTLLLLHDAFSETIGSFENLLHQRRWLQEISGSKGVYEQIVGFDRGTIFEGLDENRLKLISLLRENRFTNPVDVLAIGQGSLLLKELITNEDSMRVLNIRRAIALASSNGVGLMRKYHLARFLTYMRYFSPIFTPWNAFISALAQHSAQFVLKLPGLSCLQPENVKELMYRRIAFDSEVAILPVVGKFNVGRADHKFFRRLDERGLVSLYRRFWGPKHDWIPHFSREVDAGPARLPFRVGKIDPMCHTFDNVKDPFDLTSPGVLEYIEMFVRSPSS